MKYYVLVSLISFTDFDIELLFTSVVSNVLFPWLLDIYDANTCNVMLRITES